MKAKILSLLLLSIFSPVGQALACPFCYGAKDGKSTEHMADADRAVSRDHRGRTEQI